MNARSRAIANENASIEASQSRAIAAREVEQSRPRTALELLAGRLSVDPKVLTTTLRSTVFSACRSNEEFIALVVVANEYQLNPLLKEIYAFPAKGGGIVPMVGVDGWMKLMNSHPMFDGIEFMDLTNGKGDVVAIEAIVYRKDRAHPTKIIEYLDECRRGTEPWKMMPRRMLRNRTICQAARLAFGFTGIAVEGDEEVTVDRGTITPQSLPDTRSTAEYLDDEIPSYDSQTGEVIDQPAEPARDAQTGMTEVDEATARELDQRQAAEETMQAIDGPPEGDGGDQPEPEDEGPAAKQLRLFWNRLEAAKTKQDVVGIEADFLKVRAVFDDEPAAAFDKAITRQMKALPNEVQG